MLQDAGPLAFLGTTDYARARAFYEGVLGLTVTAHDDFALMLDVGGCPVRIVHLPQVTPSEHTLFGFTHADVRGKVRSLAAKGVEFVRYEMFGDAQDADGVWTPPGGSAGVAWFRDPDGNLLSISGGGR